MMAKPMKTLELHYPMIQFLINRYVPRDRVWFLKFSIFLNRVSFLPMVACIASVSVGFRSKELPREKIGGG